jgi:hypothetical protein
MTTLSSWCPAGVTDPESSDPGDLGDFGEPTTPPFESQKNMITIGYDPRTGVLLMHSGSAGAFGEDPPTNPTISRSVDCGKTWTPLFDIVVDGGVEPYDTGYGGDGFINAITWQPCLIIPGAEPREWLWFDHFGGYYFSADDGESWSARRMSSSIEEGIIPVGADWEQYNHLLGHVFAFDTRSVTGFHYLEEGVIGYTYGTERDQIADGYYHTGVRRSLVPNGGSGFGDWGDSLIPNDSPAGNGSGWSNGVESPVLHGANGRWIVMVDYAGTLAPESGLRTPNARINTSPDLDPSGWGEPFWVVSQSFVQDYYGGASFGPATATLREFTFRQGHARLKFIPQNGHAAGGRWWLMGLNDFLLFSDDNGETWDTSLMNHSGPEEAMHPMLNWRASHPYTTRATPARVLDIIHDPLSAGRLMAIGITYDRDGISNRLAVFSCSVDGGDTWGSVGQLPFRLSNIQSVGAGVGSDAPAVARHGFPCFRPVEP